MRNLTKVFTVISAFVSLKYQSRSYRLFKTSHNFNYISIVYHCKLYNLFNIIIEISFII